VSRRGYAIALAVAVAVLVGSMAVAAMALVGLRLHRGEVREGAIYGRSGDGPGMLDPGFTGEGQVSVAQATKIATDWLASNQAGAQLGDSVWTPMGYAFPVTRSGATVGMLVVRHRDGRVAYREFQPVASPAPSVTSTA
jgi:hypothetical protein